MPGSKSRMISVRISDQDYREIKCRCDERGVDSVSEFVRVATMYALGSTEALSSPAFASLQLSALERRMDRVDQLVSMLAERLGVVYPQPD